MRISSLHHTDSMICSTLYRILYTIIDQLYGNNIACSFKPSAAETVARAYKIESQLSEWQQGLPPELRLITTADLATEILPPEGDTAVEAWQNLRLRFILTLRYTNIRILLHRPILVKFLEGFDTSPNNHEMSLLRQVGTNSIQIAIQSAKEIIGLVHSAVRSSSLSKKRGLLGAWWFSLYYSTNPLLHSIIGSLLIIIFSIQRSFGTGWLRSDSH
jgi:hypothetical protein